MDKLCKADSCPRSGIAAAFIIVTMVWVGGLLQWILGDQVVPWDSKNQFYAFYRFMAAAIQSGSTPFWNPFHYSGHPSAADPQSLIFALPFLLWAFINPAPSLYAFDAFVLSHLLIGAWAIVLFGRAERWPVAASVLAASIFMLGGAVSGRMNHVGIICSYGLFPLAFLWMRIAIDKNSVWSAIGFAMVASQIALGRSQVALLLCFMLVVAFVAHIAAKDRAFQTLQSRALVILVMGVVALLLTAPPLLLTLQFISLSNRPTTPVELALGSSMHPLNFATFFSADVFGSLRAGTDGWGPSSATLKNIDVTDRAFNYMFCGTLTALIIVWHGIAGGRFAARGRRILAIILIVALAYTMGRFTPVYEFAFQYVPGLSLFRRPNDAAFILVLCVAYMSGYLTADYIRDGSPRPETGSTFVVFSAIIVLAIGSVAFASLSSRSVETTLQIVTTIILLLLLAAILKIPQSIRSRTITMTVLVIATSTELIWRNAGNVLNARPAAEYSLLKNPTAENLTIIQTIETDIAKTSSGPFRPRIEVLGLDGPWQNAAMIYGFEAINGYNPLRIGKYDSLIVPGESPHDVNRRSFPKTFPDYNCVLSRRLSLRYLLLDKPISELSRKHDATKFTLLLEGPYAWLYRNEDESPRVSIRSQVRMAATDNYNKAVDLLTFDGPILVDSNETLSQVYAGKKTSRSHAHIANWRVDQIELDIQTSEPAIVTLNGPNYPGWEVEVDGVRKPIISVDLIFRGVEVPAGASKLVFVFRPFTFHNMHAALMECCNFKQAIR